MKKLLLLLAAATLSVPSFAASPQLAKKAPTKVPKLSEFKLDEKTLERWKAPTQRQSVAPAESPLLKLPKASAEAAAKAQAFKCALIGSDKWGTSTPYGAYSFTTDDINTFTLLYRNAAAPANAGGFFTDTRFVYTDYEESSSSQLIDDDYTVYTYIYDTSTWKLVTSVDQDSRYALAYDLAYDPIEKVAFGAFYDGTDSSSYWGYMDPSDGSITQIAQLEGILVAVAITNEGKAYAITSGGYLASVDKYKGTLTAIGYTGLTPSSQIQQSAAFAEDGTLYWSVGQYSSSSGYATGLVTVDTTTGKASLVGAYEDYENVVALYCEPIAADEGAPADATDLTLNFVDDALTGTVSFGVPSVDNQGNTITGEVGYIIYVDGEESVTGNAAVGQTASVTVSVPSAGVHTIAVKLKNDKGLSQRVAVSQWIGIDRPVAVTDLTLTKTDTNVATLTWTAPTAGALGGYFDAARLNYTVTRLSDNKVVATKLTDTSFVDNLDLTEQLYVSYSVTAYADDVAGASATSNGAVFGPAYNTPVSFGFDNEAAYNLFTVIDTNETLNLDSGQWQYSPSGECAGYVCGTKDGDDWIISPDINLKADRQYTISYDVLCYSNYWPDNYELYIGAGATVEAMTTKLQENTQIYWDEYRTNTITFTVPADGVYNFGWRALSEAGGAFFCLDNIEVNDSYMLKAPKAVTNFKVVAGELGAANATITCTLPSKAVDESDLSAITTVNVYRNYVLYDQVTGNTPGASFTYVDSKANEGNTIYSVSVSSSDGEGPQESQTVWVGLDTPSEPTVHISINEDGNPVISWDAPQGAGQNGGYVDNSDLTYIVYRVADGETVVNGTTDMQYVDEEMEVINEGDQELFQYGVYAQNSQGIGYPGTNFYINGEKYKLPFNESFAGGKTDKLVLLSTTVTSTDGYDTWMIDNDYNVDSQDSDKGSMLILPATPGLEASIQMGKIDMTNAKNSVLSFYVKKLDYMNDYPETSPEDDYLEVFVGGSDYETTLVSTVRPVDMESNKFQKFEVSLADYEGSDFIFLQFKLTAGGAYYAVDLDNITVRSNYDTNLIASSLVLPSSVDVLSDFTATVTVVNDGQKDAGASKVAIKVGDTVVAEKDVEAISVGKSATVEFTLTALAAWASEQTLTAEVTIDGDESAEDNTVDAVLNIIRPTLAPVSDLKADEGNNEATFTWSPATVASIISVVDGFEDYANFAKNSEATGWVGDWTMIDNDGNMGIGADVYVSSYFAYRAFTVFDPEDGENGDADTWAAHTGTKSAVAFPNFYDENDDWIVTPRLSGNAQTISFWARGIKAGTDALIVYYTTEEEPTVANFKAAKKLSDRDIDLTTEWTQYSYDVPEGALYFAIRYYVDGGEGALIDDVQFERVANYNVTPEVIGYNLYHKGEKVNDAVITETTYHVSGQIYGDYYVTVVYNVGESAQSNIVTVLTSVNDITVDADDADQATYDTFGRRVYKLQEGQLYLRKGQKFIYRK